MFPTPHPAHTQKHTAADFVTKIPTHGEDFGRGEIRPARPIFKFSAAKGDSESNVNLQATHALARIDFGVEMATQSATPSPLPLPKLPTTKY